MQFEHIARDTSHGAYGVPPWFVVRCGIRCSNSLSNSIMKATSASESSVDKGKPA
jgi:hypothetical protein